MHAHVPRGAATAMEGPCFDSSLASGKLDGHSARNQKVEWRPSEAVSAPGGEGQKNQFQPERPEQAIDTSVRGRVNRVLLPRFTCK